LFISSITASQVYKAISPIIRKNLTSLYIWKLRNWADMQAWLEELSAMLPKDLLEEMYKIATSVPYGFLYIHLTAEDPKNMFWCPLKKRLIISPQHTA
jgi:hypothetical protein